MSARIFPFGALLIAAGVFFGYAMPTYDGPIAKAHAVIAEDNKALAAAADYAIKENELVSAKNAISPQDLDRLTKLLPDSVDNVRLTIDLNALAARSGVQLSALNVAKQDAAAAGDGNPVGSATLSLSVTGSYNAFLTFLRNIEHSNRLLDVTDLAVQTSDTGVYSYQLSLRLYWLH